MLGGRYRRGAGAGEDDANLPYFLADDFHGVEECSAGDDCRAVLVVVEDGNLHGLPQRLFDVETIGRANVLQIYSAHRRLEELTEPDHVLRIFRTDLEIEDVEIRELLEQVTLSFHHRLPGERTDVAKP